MMILRLRRRPDGRIDRNDAGSTLILVLVFVSFFSILIAGLLTMVDTSFKEVVAIREQRHSTYAAESGLEAAIQFIRTSPTQGVIGTCSDVTATGVNGEVVVVKCTPDSDSGLVQPGDDAQSLPRHALLTVDTDADSPSRGVDLSSGGLQVQGALFSNSQVRLGGGATLSVTNGALNVRAGCTGSVSPACNTTTTVEDDPQYPPAATSFALTDPPPVCAAGTATFASGRYTQTPEALISATPGCTSITAESFPAAVSPTVAAYYFNFAGSGNALRWQTSRSIRVGLDATGGCSVGAQMIFGGGSWMDLQQNSLLHVCAYRPASGQRIGIYGAGSVVRLRPMSTATSGLATGTAFTPATTATVRNFDTSHATATVTANGSRQSIRMDGFNQGWNGGPLSASGSLTSAKIRIRHSESETNSSRMSVSVTVAPADGATPFTLVSGSCGSIPNCSANRLTLSNSMHEDSYELTQASPGWTSPTRFNGAAVTYTVIHTHSGGAAKTGRLDGVWLDLVYAPPGLAAASGTVLSGADFLLRTPNTSDADVKVTGTLYAPAARVNLNLGQACDQALSRGAIVWRLNVSLTGSCTPVSSPISLPASTSGIANDRVVVLESYVGCLPGACPAKIRARVRFPSSGTPPRIEKWTVIKQ